MTGNQLVAELDKAYTLITEKKSSAKLAYEEKGIHIGRIQYEDVSLSDILDTTLVPLLIPLIDNYKSLPKKSKQQAYCVYVAALCEIVKNGLVGGGILKTIEARIGDFNVNNHYSLIKAALRYEGIPISQKHRKYEETIINEAGIPRGYHRICLELFLLYWKWMHNYDNKERKKFLESSLNCYPIDRVYIIDSEDRSRFKHLVDCVESFSEKVEKTCQKLDAVFCAIDDYKDSITDQNIDAVAETISTDLGFNIFTVIKSKSLKQYILDYAKKVSFGKFERIMRNMSGSEVITLPTSIEKTIDSYKPENYLGGRHYIRNNAYDVSFPIPLEISDIFHLVKNHPYMFGNAVLYTSDDDIWVERDGYERPYRTFFDENYGSLNAYYERIYPASFTYIDGVLVSGEESFYKKTYICKFWNGEIKHHQLGVCISDIKLLDSNYSMCPVKLTINDEIAVQGMTNQSGFFRIKDKIIPFDNLNSIPAEIINIRFYANDELVDEWEIEVLKTYIWGLQSGTRIYETIDLSGWYGSTRFIVFSTEKNENNNLKRLYEESGYIVYEGEFDKTDRSISVFDKTIEIVKPTHPYIELTSQYEVVSSELCIREEDPLSVLIHNANTTNNELILEIEHEHDVLSYNYKNIPETALRDIRILIPNNKNEFTYVGEWNISLFDSGVKKHALRVFVLPSLQVNLSKDIYLENEPVEAIVSASADCFESEGSFVNNKRVEFGSALLIVDKEEVQSKELESDCYIDRCLVSEMIKVTPNVWKTQFRFLDNGELSDVQLNNIDVECLKTQGLYIYSSCNMSVIINANGISEKKYIKEGANFIDCKSFLQDAETRTLFRITDSNKSCKELTFVYKEKIDIISMEDGDASVVFKASYEGPVNQRLFFRFYSGDSLVCTLEKKAIKNRFTTDLPVKKKLLLGKTISVEVRAGDQDYEQIYKAEYSPNILDEDFTVSNHNGIINILKLKQQTENAFKDSLLFVLRNGVNKS